MASKRGGGPGTYSTNGVRCTMDAPFSKPATQREGNGGVYGSNKAPFDKPQSAGGIPPKFYDNLSASQGTRTPAPGQTGPSSQGQVRPGTKQYAFGGKTKDGN